MPMRRERANSVSRERRVGGILDKVAQEAGAGTDDVAAALTSTVLKGLGGVRGLLR